MLLTKTVKIKWRSTVKSHYENKGYKFTKLGDEFEVKVEDLTKSCAYKVKCLCDYCLEEGVETIIEKPYSKYYTQNIDAIVHKDCCRKCSHKKLKESNLLQYGVDNPMKVKEISTKSKISLKTPIEDVRQGYRDMNFTPLFTDEEYYNSSWNNYDSRKLKCYCNKHPNIIQYKEYNRILEGWGCKYCRDENNKGENHWNWHGGEASIIHYLRHCQEMKYWKYDSLKANRFSCYLTYDIGDSLEIHHQKISFNEIVKQSFKELNIEYRDFVTDYTDEELRKIKTKILQLHYKVGYGIPLRKDIHQLFHKIYGFKDNNIEQFYEFCSTYWYGDLNKLTKDNYKELLIDFI